MIKRTVAFGLVAVVAFSACNGKSGGKFEVSGTLKNTTSKLVYLQEIPMTGGQPILLDSSKVVDGKYSLKGLAKEESLFQLDFENSPGILVVNDETSVVVDVDMDKRDNFYSVKGSPATEAIRSFIFNYTGRQEDMQKVFMTADSLQKAGVADSILQPALLKREQEMVAFNNFVKESIDKEKSPAASMFMVGMAGQTLDQPAFTALLNSTAKKFEGHNGFKSLKETFEKQIAAIEQRKQQAQQAPKADAWVGKPAPALSLPDMNGKKVSISDFKGKYVLVDFWASWCAPCRQENPNVVKAFNRFKSKNFTILGVSLDDDKASWTKAVSADQLGWAQVSDLKKWESEAQKVFKFEGIPFNVLVDPAGMIIAENLRGPDLEMALEHFIK